MGLSKNGRALYTVSPFLDEGDDFSVLELLLDAAQRADLGFQELEFRGFIPDGRRRTETSLNRIDIRSGNPAMNPTPP